MSTAHEDQFTKALDELGALNPPSTAAETVIAPHQRVGFDPAWFTGAVDKIKGSSFDGVLIDNTDNLVLAQNSPHFDVSVQSIVNKMLDERYKEPPRELHTTFSQMTVRDQFAAQAMDICGPGDGWDIEFIKNFLGLANDAEYIAHVHYPMFLAKYSYRIADAMIQVSKEPPCSFRI